MTKDRAEAGETIRGAEIAAYVTAVTDELGDVEERYA